MWKVKTLLVAKDQFKSVCYCPKEEILESLARCAENGEGTPAAYPDTVEGRLYLKAREAGALEYQALANAEVIETLIDAYEFWKAKAIALEEGKHASDPVKAVEVGGYRVELCWDCLCRHLKNRKEEKS
jgi:hypothetical protein